MQLADDLHRCAQRLNIGRAGRGQCRRGLQVRFFRGGFCGRRLGRCACGQVGARGGQHIQDVIENRKKLLEIRLKRCRWMSRAGGFYPRRGRAYRGEILMGIFHLLLVAGIGQRIQQGLELDFGFMLERRIFTFGHADFSQSNLGGASEPHEHQWLHHCDRLVQVIDRITTFGGTIFKRRVDRIRQGFQQGRHGLDGIAQCAAITRQRIPLGLQRQQTKIARAV